MRKISIWCLLLLLCASLLPAGAETVRCSVCGREIVGRYVRSNGAVFCLDDYEKVRPRCSMCGKKLTDKYFVRNGSPICKECYHKSARHCCICGKDISGKYLIFDRDIFSCISCYNSNLPRCVTCGCPVDDRKVAPLGGAGGYACSRHAKQAIISDAKATALMKSVYGQLQYTLGSRMKLHAYSLNVCLVNLQTLMQRCGSANYSLRGFCSSERLGARTRHTIYVLSGINEKSMRKVLAHELGHAWQFENNPNVTHCTPLFKEGFAEWVAYKNTEVYGTRSDLEDMLANQASPEYSQGLRRFLDYEENLGKSGILKMATNYTSF